MRTTVLLVWRQFGGSQVKVAQVKEWVVAETFVTTFRGQNFTMPFAFGDNRLRVVGVAHVNDDGYEMRLAFGAIAQFSEQLLVVARIAFGLVG